MKRKFVLFMSLVFLLSGCSNNVSEEPVVEEPVVEEPVVEFNYINYKELYGLDFDVPIFTNEYIDEAKNRLANDYANFDYNTASKDEKHELYRDIYIVNQKTFYQLNDMLADFDFEGYLNSDHFEWQCYYDEENDICIHITYSDFGQHTDMIKVFGKNYIFTKYNNDRFYVGVGGRLDEDTFGQGVIQIGKGSTVEINEFAYTDYEVFSDFNRYPVGDINELYNFGMKKVKLEDPVISIW